MRRLASLLRRIAPREPGLALLIALAACLAPGAAALGHDVTMAVLQLDEGQAGRFMVHWTEPAGGAGLTLVYPPQCRLETPILDCGDKGLAGELGLTGWGPRQSAAILRLGRRAGPTQVFTLTAAAPSVTIVAGLGDDSLRGRLLTFGAYVSIGIEHILLGLDHLLFVLGLIWIVRSRWMLVKTITAFTVAHSVTLAAVTLGWVGLPERAVSAAIALSIVFLAVEMLRAGQGQGSLAVRHPWAVAFAFGLLHGFGFASGLAQLGLPQALLPLGLLGFNVGVEIGQLSFVVLVLALVWSFRTLLVRWPLWSRPLPAYAIGGVAAFWLIGRIDLLFVPP